MDDALVPALKSALRNLVRSVVVVTARLDGQPYAMAATAVSEVSLAPPSMLVCINRNAAIFQAIDAGSDLMLNVLSEEHEAVSRACGGDARGGQRFAIGAWDDDADSGPPVLRDACAVIRLKQAHVVDHGSHRIVIGDVQAVDLPAPKAPLAYFAGRYVQMAVA